MTQHSLHVLAGKIKVSSVTVPVELDTPHHHALFAVSISQLKPYAIAILPVTLGRCT
jgi:hypothetical protein